jgi:hypothetical protein
MLLRDVETSQDVHVLVFSLVDRIVCSNDPRLPTTLSMEVYTARTTTNSPHFVVYRGDRLALCMIHRGLSPVAAY